MAFFNFLSNDLAIDLGTANTLIWMKGKNIVLNEPTIVAFERNSKEIIAIGKDAKAMLGKTHKDISVIRPLKDGAIADFEITEGFLKALIRQASSSWQPARRIVVCVPSGITEVEKRAVRDACEHAGAKEVHLVAEPMASAIGVGLNVHESSGNMIVDIGGGTTEIAVISLSGIVVSDSIRTAGDEMTESISNHFRKKHNLLIGDRTAEQIKISVGSAVALENEMEIEVKGRNTISGLPDQIVTNSTDIRGALNDTVTQMVSAILNVLEQVSGELAADIYEKGIILTGGGALLQGLDERIRKETSLPVHIGSDPLTAVVRGTGRILENLSDYSSVLIKSTRY